jgi:hypothetical protein
LFLFASLIQQPPQQYIYAQIPGVSLSDNNNLIINNTYTTTTNNTTNNNLLMYDNSDFGFKVQYPPSSVFKAKEEHKEQEEKQGKGEITVFPIADFPIVSFIFHSGGQLSIFVKPAEKFLDTNDLQVKEKTPQLYAIEAKDSPYQKLSFYIGGKLDFIRDQPATVSGQQKIPAWRLDYVKTRLGFQTYNIDFYVVKNEKVYDIKYDDDPLDVPKSLSIAQKMIDSFQIIK